MKKILSQKFFDRPTLTVARELLGKLIVREYRGKRRALMVTEVEAYDGPLDRASHAYRGLTPRTKVMFGPPGYFYVYFTYGMHWLVNIVTGPKGYPAAVLLRTGIYKNPKTGEMVAVKGPARLTKFLKIDGAQTGLKATRATGLWFEDRSVKVQRTHVSIGKRIGVDYAEHTWKNKPYNFTLTLLK